MMLLQVSQGKTIGKALLVSDDLIFALSIVRTLESPALRSAFRLMFDGLYDFSYFFQKY